MAMIDNIKKLYPELNKGYIDLNKNGRAEDKEFISKTKKQQVDLPQILEFILNNVRVKPEITTIANNIMLSCDSEADCAVSEKYRGRFTELQKRLPGDSACDETSVVLEDYQIDSILTVPAGSLKRAFWCGKAPEWFLKIKKGTTVSGSIFFKAGDELYVQPQYIFRNGKDEQDTSKGNRIELTLQEDRSLQEILPGFVGGVKEGGRLTVVNNVLFITGDIEINGLTVDGMEFFLNRENATIVEGWGQYKGVRVRIRVGDSNDIGADMADVERYVHDILSIYSDPNKCEAVKKLYEEAKDCTMTWTNPATKKEEKHEARGRIKQIASTLLVILKAGGY